MKINRLGIFSIRRTFMKIKYLFLNILAIIGLSFLFTSAASTEEIDSNDLLSQVKIYDENNNEIPYTTKELEQLIKFNVVDSSFKSSESVNLISPMATYRKYNYGPTFSYQFYVGGGTNGIAFYNPVDTLIKVNGTAQKIKIIAYNDTGTGSGTAAKTIELPGGWTGEIHMSTWSSLPRGKSYRFKVINVDNKSFTINNIQVWYD